MLARLKTRARCFRGLGGLWIVLGSALSATAQTPSPALTPVLTNAAQLRALTAAEAATGRPVRLRGVVTALNPKASVFIQDATGGTFLTRISSRLYSLKPGDEVLVEGVTYPGLFVTGIVNAEARKLGHAELPPPVPATYDDLSSGRHHYERVEVVGIVRSVRLQRRCPILTLALGTRKLDVEIVVSGITNLPALVDARVRVVALAAGYINARRQLRAPELLVSRLQDLRVEVAPPADPFAGSKFNSAAGASGHRVRVRGVVTHQQAGAAIFLRDAAEGLLVQTPQATPAKPGDIIEAVGFPVMGRFSAHLEDAEFDVVGRETPPEAALCSVDQIMRGTNDANLVTVQGKVLDVVRSAHESILVVAEKQTVFRARLAGKPAAVRSGSQVRLSGVCRVAESNDRADRFRANPLELELLLRSPADIVVLSKPSAWTAQRFAIVAALLLGVALVAGVWVVLLRRRVARQSAVILDKVQREAVLEERHRMAREMHDTLAQSFSGLGFQLDALNTRLPPEQTDAHTQLEVAREMVRYGREGLRRSLMNLRAQELERGSLPEALPELARQITVGTGIELRCDVQRPPKALPDAVETNLLRIGQECLVNAVRHAHPKTIQVTLSHEPDRVQLHIRDDGAGFDAEQLQANGNGHFGWRGIRERATHIGAELILDTQTGRGTAVTVTVPLQP